MGKEGIRKGGQGKEEREGEVLAGRDMKRPYVRTYDVRYFSDNVVRYAYVILPYMTKIN